MRKEKNENNIEKIKTSIDSIENSKKLFNRQVSKKQAAKAKIEAMLAQTQESLSNTEKELKEKTKGLSSTEEKIVQLKAAVEDTKLEIRKTERYLVDIKRLQLPKPFVQMVQNFKIVFDKIHIIGKHRAAFYEAKGKNKFR